MSKKEIRQEMINYLCGKEGLKDEFIDLLEQGGLSEDEGYEIKKKLLNEVDSSKDLNLVFISSFENKSVSMKKLKKYTSNEDYLELVKMQYPQSVDEAIDTLIEEMNKEDIDRVKEFGKDEFAIREHFGLALYVRNHFGLNNGKADELLFDISEKGGMRCLVFSDESSGFLMEELWERIQKDYDKIIQSKE